MRNAGLFALNIKAQQNYKFLEQTLNEIEKKFVGNEDFVKDVILALISGESILVESAIGSAKELFVKTLSEISNLTFNTFYLTSDSKIPNGEELNSNIILLENYKKAPESVQSFFANLVNKKGFYENKKFIECSDPFLVLATFKKGESFDEEYLDKFAISTEINLPDKYEEMEILNRETKQKIIETKQVISAKVIKEIQGFVKGIHTDESLNEKIVDFIQELRNSTKSVITPRTSIHLILLAKANALLNKRGKLEVEDIKEVLSKVLNHRIFEKNKEDLILKKFKKIFY